MKTKQFNKELQEALKEAEEMKKHPEKDPQFHTVEELIQDLEK